MAHLSDNSSEKQLVVTGDTAEKQLALVANYNDRIRPLLDAVDKLRQLKLMKEGIQLPTIVVVGDQSSGKSSVLESLAGISLPRGQGICTRVPLIMRLQRHLSPKPELYLEFHGKTVETDEAHIAEAISLATDEIAGNGKGISNIPLTLIVKKEGVPDLTMVDLPGITRVPVHGQPEDIYEQISSTIMEYISPNESIILNVLSATVDFSTCESIRMSQKVDVTGQRTLAVVTKPDKAPEGLLEKVTADDVNIGLGYVCVRNRIGEETYEQARREETKLFELHPLLSKIDKSIVGIPVLAQNLVKIQATIISKCLPDIVRKINDRLTQYQDDLKNMPQVLSTNSEAVSALMRIINSAKETLTKILVRGEFDRFPNDVKMHCTARIAEMLSRYSVELQLASERRNASTDKFLLEEIEVLNETKGIGLPNFLPRSAFLTLLQRRVKEVSSTPIGFIQKMWDYLEEVVVYVVACHSEGYPQLQFSTRRAAKNLVLMMKGKSVERVNEIVKMEMLADYTCSPEYMSKFNSLMDQEKAFHDAIRDKKQFQFGEYAKVDVVHLSMYSAIVVAQAFDMKMRLTAYWNVVLRRLVDSLGLHLLLCLNDLVNEELMSYTVEELLGPNSGGIECLLLECPSIASRREKLQKSTKVLMEAKEVLSGIMDRIAAYNE